jgi:hypothetical protein
MKRKWDRSRVGTLCPVCQINPIKHPWSKTCSRACGAYTRVDAEQRRAYLERARARYRQTYHERVRAFVQGEIDALEGLGRPITRNDLHKAMLNVYRRAYTRGVHYELNRWKSGRVGSRSDKLAV